MPFMNARLRLLSLLALGLMGPAADARWLGNASAPARHAFNGPYAGAALSRIAFPIGGLGAGMFCLEGTGALSHMSVRNRMEFFNEPCAFAALHVSGAQPVTRVLEGLVPDWKYFGRPEAGVGSPGTTSGLPRFEEAVFDVRFPFVTVRLTDEQVPLEVSLTGWSPFIPGQADDSGLPAGALEYRFRNPGHERREMVFSFNSKNFLSVGNDGDRIEAFPGGFALVQANTALHPTAPADTGSLAVWVDDPGVVVDHCWFRGGWWDALTLAWRNVDQGLLLNNPPAQGSAPGASLFLPFTLEPGEERTIRLNFAWYFPTTDQVIGAVQGTAFGKAPSHGTAPYQLPLAGFLGRGLANSFEPSGDGGIGSLTSPPFQITKRRIHFLLGGGKMEGRACLNLVVDGKVVRTQTGDGDETLSWRTWDVNDLDGRTAQLAIFDDATEPWGHVSVDQIVLTDLTLKQVQAQLTATDGRVGEAAGITVLADFEGNAWQGWTALRPGDGENRAGESQTPATYTPHYARRFAGLPQVAEAWRGNYDRLRADSALFRDTFYDTTLPPEVIEAVAANLTILKSPTVLRQHDGRLWGWEGSTDTMGSCHGSCTHVWNYAQSLAHLFPALERSLRETEYGENFKNGAVAFRANLPISPVRSAPVAVDGQLGGIMKVYREWRISGDEAWLRRVWPHARQSLNYIIAHYDPRRTGLPEESQHNTYDINYFGPNGHIGTFYLGALEAAIQIGRALGEDVGAYEALLAKGCARLEGELFNGEYFVQKVMLTGLDKNFQPEPEEINENAYRAVSATVNRQGPKYQYGSGCLADGVLGIWLARMCGLPAEFLDEGKVNEHLRSVYRYNLRRDLSGHANPQRPSYALGREGGLLLCTWPKGGEPLLPFPYSNEVWTGIEYQAASHMIMNGMVKEGLEIVRLCRARYDGARRNPFNEYECGHWYARAMSSYGLLQALTGARYDAVDRTLYIDSRVGDFRSFLATSGGWGTVGLERGQPFLKVRKGSIPVDRVWVSGKPMSLLSR